MLPPLRLLQVSEYTDQHSAVIAQKALRGFLQAFPDGEDRYIEGVRKMYKRLYEHALAVSGKCRFLDKTPRYYLIIRQLYRTFPEARYIILLRNPLAILCSTYKTWAHNALASPDHQLDLTRAPHLLLEGIELLKDHVTVVHYEQLTRNPKEEIERLCRSFDISFDPSILEYGQHDLPRWELGDKRVYDYKRPMTQVATEWTQTLSDPQAWRMAAEYLDLLGEETIEQMGYSYSESRRTLAEHQPHWAQLWFTFSMTWLLRVSRKECTGLEHRIVRLICRLRQRSGPPQSIPQASRPDSR
jgi:hypothetical protein